MSTGNRTELVPAYGRLLRDNEAEVRIAAAGKVTKFCSIVSPQVASQYILPCVKVSVLSNYSSQWMLLLVLMVQIFSASKECGYTAFLMRCQPFAGIVNRFITTCPCCTCISYHGHGSCAWKGVVLYVLYVLRITFVSFRSVHCPCTRCFVKLKLLGIHVVLRNVDVFVFLDVVLANC